MRRRKTIVLMQSSPLCSLVPDRVSITDLTVAGTRFFAFLNDRGIVAVLKTAALTNALRLHTIFVRTYKGAGLCKQKRKWKIL